MILNNHLTSGKGIPATSKSIFSDFFSETYTSALGFLIIQAAPVTFKVASLLVADPHLLVAIILYKPASVASTFLNFRAYWFSDSFIFSIAILSLNLSSLLSLNILKVGNGFDLRKNSHENATLKLVFLDSMFLINDGLT